jgi:hypothetical protein
MQDDRLLLPRYLLADWFVHFARLAGLPLEQRGHNGVNLTFGSPEARQVTAAPIEAPPYLSFSASDRNDVELVSNCAARAAARVAANDFGSTIWYSTSLEEPQFNYFTAHGGIGQLMLRLGTQVRITGWRRLGRDVLLEFAERPSSEGNPEAPLVAPPASVKAHLAIPGPIAGLFSDLIAHRAIEAVAAVCGFALGRSIDPPISLFPATHEQSADAVARHLDSSVLTLARKGVSLDVFSPAQFDGGVDWSSRTQSALITFDAAMRQERDSVANILYVVAAECLAAPAPKWRETRVTARFVDFYVREIGADLDTIINHGNFKEAFKTRRGGKRIETLRKRLLLAIYKLRSRQVHGGLIPTYRGFGALSFSGADMQRALIHDFAEAALLSYLRAPRSSLIGHPQLFPEQAV